MSEAELSHAELTYLELTAKHAPQELPGSSAVVQRLINEVMARGNPEDVVEPLQTQIDDLQDRITQLELDLARCEAEKKEVQDENEDLQEQLEAALHAAEHLS